MAEEHRLSIAGHPSIYQPGERSLEICFCTPDRLDAATGLLLLIPGFGANLDSKVYKKMRLRFADEYNFVTVQCGYFGSEFMQEYTSARFDLDFGVLRALFGGETVRGLGAGSFEMDELLAQAAHHGKNLNLVGKLDETEGNFCDMGPMQAVDNLAALLAVHHIAKDNGISLNTAKIYAYGHSHGAYLAYLCNAFAPRLFHTIIDNSSWLFPAHLLGSRKSIYSLGKGGVTVSYNYLAQGRYSPDDELRNLTLLYRKFVNNCRILAYHGSRDTLCPPYEKRPFCLGVANCHYREITPAKVGEIFRNTAHGLGADFLKMFDHVIDEFGSPTATGGELDLPPVRLESAAETLCIDYSRGLPLLTLTPRA